MKRAMRTQGGQIGDTVFWIRRWWLGWLPQWATIGFYAYANAASARNREAVKLNKICRELEITLHAYAAAEATVANENKNNAGSRFDHLGMSKVGYVDMRELKGMVPMVDEPEPKFKKWIYSHRINDILREYDVVPESTRRKSKMDGFKPHVMVTSPEGKPSAQREEQGEQVVSWQAPSNKKSQGNNQSSDKARRKQLRNHNPKWEDETPKEYEQRINELLHEE
jgi:hypothetical protein